VYPEVQKKIQQEVDSIITSDDENVLENKAKLHYTSKNQLIEVNAKRVLSASLFNGTYLPLTFKSPNCSNQYFCK